MAGAQRVRAPRVSAHGWPQEAALRRVRNALDPQVAEHPDALGVHGGTQGAARGRASSDAITLIELRGDETKLTLLVQSGRPVGVLRAQELADERGVRVPRREGSADDAPTAEAGPEEGAA